MKTYRYPMQPVVNGRFESNPIVDWLCTEVSNMNDIAFYCAENDIDKKYQEQLAQLVGYSVGGYGTLSYVSDESYERAENQMNIDTIATQTPEEKEALDQIKESDSQHLTFDEFQKKVVNSIAEAYDVAPDDLIDTTPHQYEMGKFSMRNPTLEGALKAVGELDKFNDAGKLKRTPLHKAVDKVEWNGEGLPPVGVECEFKDGDGWIRVKVNYLSDWVMVIEAMESKGKVIDVKGVELSFDHSRFKSLTFRKPESPEEKEQRERLEAAEVLYNTYMKVWDCAYIGWDVLDSKNKDAFLAIVDKTNYRKGE